MSIEIREVTKHYGSFQALKDINLTIAKGELVALLGPSGSGKTTLLRMIAGLESIEEGSIAFDGKDLSTVHVNQRDVGFVFQHYALFKHMTVFDNVAFGLNVRKKSVRPSKKDIEQKVHELLELVKLSDFAQRYPSQLSGGQRQRVALARALAVEPKMLLLDEPFGALDAKVRKELRRWLRKLHNEMHITSVFVTHDQEEALDVADRIVIMNKGKIEQVGTPSEVYDKPVSPFVYDFLGNVNLFHGRLQQGKLNLGSAQLDAPDYIDQDGADAVGYVRPHHLKVERVRQSKDEIAAKITFMHSVGPTWYLEMRREDIDAYVEVELSKEEFIQLDLKIGEIVYVSPKEMKVFIPEDFII
ncbi:sulfate/molybdate ABC transporter ATP-binding protein [Metasolibacillus meyeri]|uniref:Sulfate/molybdate ABC transporter ATP-binding protein n=1 Tax=Metasolibacillus meyeri TaxID=1071052 RepID=A0AAW9NJD5_9BACL|nr:sulfate/molybdate ABC transporter ATP-binding protein [Metasolibacillus meyeri]MEC1177842.1 sulfate/molybdate ABC transporter ATP-binding protein [Metasolibacillus meyeri]